jgi:hypothetical protein
MELTSESGGRILSSAGGGIEIDFPDGASLVATPLFWSYYGVWYLNLHVYRTRATRGIMGIIQVPIITAGMRMSLKQAGYHCFLTVHRLDLCRKACMIAS